MKNYFILFTVLLSCTTPSTTPTFQMLPQEVNTSSLLIGMSILDEKTAWGSGTNATLVHTIDGGNSWDVFTHPTADSLQFRDIHGFDNEKAVVMSSGVGESSRIFKFNASNEWKTTFVMEHPEGFLDCMDFWDEKNGVAYGDSFDEYLFILTTNDGGETWQRVSAPKSTAGEGGFAASGTCVRTGKDGQAWIGTGAGKGSRVLFTADYGQSWEFKTSPISEGNTSGITSLAYLNKDEGFITGGSIVNDSTFQENLFYTIDSGDSWQQANQPITIGAFYGSAYTNVNGTMVTVICGPKGADISFDKGKTWKNLSTDNLWTVNLLSSGKGWLMGRNGKIIKIDIK